MTALHSNEVDHRSALEPGLQAWLDKVNRARDEARERGVPYTPAAERAGLAAMTLALGGQGPSLPWVRDAQVDADGHGVPIRLYDPDPALAKPVCVYLHGGGHMAGSIEVYDPICRRLADASGRLVVSVEYRLAPEHPYPDGLMDCLAVLRELPSILKAQERLTLPGVALAGDSGGGALAATLASGAWHHAPLKLDRLILVYPSLDYTLGHASLHENGRGYLLETDKIRWYFDHYFQHGEDRRQSSPLHMPVRGLPPTLVVTAGLCPLRDEGLAYVARLAQAGVMHEHLHFPSLPHAYLNLHELVPQACERTYGAIGAFLADAGAGAGAGADGQAFRQ